MENIIHLGNFITRYTNIGIILSILNLRQEVVQIAHVGLFRLTLSSGRINVEVVQKAPDVGRTFDGDVTKLTIYNQMMILKLVVNTGLKRKTRW